MNTLQQFSDAPAWSALGWTILHFLWQGTVISLAAAALLRVLRNHPATTRYAAACGAMLLCLLAFIGTFLFLLPSGSSAPVDAAPLILTGTNTLPATAEIGPGGIIAWCWAAGFLLMSARYTRHWLWAQRLKSQQVSEPGARWRTLFQSLKEDLGIPQAVRLLQSGLAETAMVVGWFKPVILIPVCAFTSLTPDQLRAVLAHELAHIRRHDQWANLLQGLVETLLFFHPATWWISRRIHVEREYCCDDSSLRSTDNPRNLAEALARLESLRIATPATGLAANGGSLVDRIARILKTERPLTQLSQAPRITMNKTLATIGAATLLLGSLIIVQARDTITRKEFENAAHQLEKGVEDGKISKEAARAGIEGLRRAMGEEAKRDRKPADRKDPEHIGREIRKAVAEGKITEEEGRKKMEAIRRKMAAEGERDHPKRDADRERERNPREIYARAEAELKQAVERGRITEEQAKERLEGLRKRLSGDREHDQPREDAAHDIGEGIGKHLKAVGDRLKTAVVNGDMTADEAWAKWHEVKKTQVAPRLEAAVKEGKLSEQDAKAIWHAIERAEVGEKLKAAVAAGEMTEEDARAKWEAYEKKSDR